MEKLSAQLAEMASALLPKLAAALVVVIVGALGAALARRLVRRLVEISGLDALAERVGAARLLYAIGLRGGVGQGAARLAGWACWVVTLYVAIVVLAIPGLERALAALLAFVPSLLAASAVALAGYLGAVWLGDLVRGGAEQPSMTRRAGALSVQGLIGMLAGVAALEQLGLDAALLEGLVVGVAAALALAAAVGFAIGARSSFADTLHGHFVRQSLKVGDHLETPWGEGVIVGFTTSRVVLAQGERELWLPYGELLERVIDVVMVEGSEADDEEE